MSEQNDLKKDLVRDRIITFIKMIKDNKNKVFQYSSLIFIVIIGYSYYDNSKQATEKEAKILSGNAQNLYIDSKVDDAIDDFNNVLANFPSTSSANISKFYLADDYIKNEMVEDAIALYREISGSLKDEVLRSSVLNKIGDIYLDQNNLDKALDFYKKASNVKTSSSFNNQYLFNIAKVYKIKEEYSKAIKIIEEILKDDDIKYNLKNETQQLEGELNFLISK